jgi:hypothetical protein
MAKTIEEQKAILQDRINADTAKLAELNAAEDARELIKGDVVTFNYGRGETRKQYTGTVAGTTDTDKGTKIKVVSGEGFETEIFVIDPSAVISVQSDEQPEENNAADTDPLASIQ